MDTTHRCWSVIHTDITRTYIFTTLKIFHDEKADYFPGFTVCSHGISQRHELQPSSPAGPVPDGQDGLRAEPHR